MFMSLYRWLELGLREFIPPFRSDPLRLFLGVVPSSSSAQKFLPLPRAMREYFRTVFLSIEILIKPLGPSAEKSASRDWFFSRPS